MGHIIGHADLPRGEQESAVFSRARWCFRQCAWPARRHARKNHWRARENTGLGMEVVIRHQNEGSGGRDLKCEISDLRASGRV